MHALANAILITWKRNREYALRLVADVGPDQMLDQPMGWSDPARVMNHPAWILSHLRLYASVCESMLLELPFADPMGDRHGSRSVPVGDPGAYDADLVARFRDAHDAAQRALEAAPASVFAAPTPLERWKPAYPTIADIVLMLMVKHESGHLGQLSAWRRAKGLPPVAM